MSRGAEEERRAVRVTIAGEQYVLRTGADEAHTKKCAAIVDERMKQAGAEGGLERDKVAVMAALLLADDLLRGQSEAENLAARLDAAIED